MLTSELIEGGRATPDYIMGTVVLHRQKLKCTMQKSAT